MENKNSHYYSEQPTVESDERTIKFNFLGNEYTFITDNGVFSKAHVDNGSILLLQAYVEEMQALELEDQTAYNKLLSSRKLDLGCGYGVIGIVGQKLFPGGNMHLVDVNERALSLSERNAKRNTAKGIEVIKRDGFTNLNYKYSLILTNPPMRTGKESVHRLLTDAYEHLEEGGLLLAVIGKKQGAASYVNFLDDLFPESWISLKKKGFTVIACKK